MDLGWNYPVIVQRVQINGRFELLGYIPDFGIRIYEPIDPGSSTQEYLFHVRLRRKIDETIYTYKKSGKAIPTPTSALDFGEYNDGDQIDFSPTPLVSVQNAAKQLGVHPETVRRLFDAGTLKGSLTPSGQRRISLQSIEKEKTERKKRAEHRVFENRAKRINKQRQMRRAEKRRRDKQKKIQESLSELIPENDLKPFPI